MNRRPLVVLSLAVVAVMAAIGGWAWLQLPADAQVPTHWGLDGRVDGWVDKTVGLFALPVGTLVLSGVFAALPLLEPRRLNLERSSRGYRAIWLAVVVLMASLQVAIVAVALDNELDIARFMVIGAGALFVVIGNYLPTIRSNWFIGIRTPWTLSSERSWERTHRAGGRLFVALGILYVAAGVLGVGGQAGVGLLAATIAIGVVGLTAYSFVVWRTDPNRRTSS